MHVRVTNMVFPQAFVIPLSPEMTITQWHVPVDDTAATGTRSSPASTGRSTRQRCARSASSCTSCPTTCRACIAATTRASTRTSSGTRTYTGMGFDINVHDQWAVESQGPIHDRTREYLGTTDKSSSRYRRVLMKAIEQATRGERPPMVLDAGRGEARARADDDRRDRAGRRLAAVLARVRRRSDGGARPGRPDCPIRSPAERRDELRRPLRSLDRRPARGGAGAPRGARGRGVEVIRFSFPDQHGILRGKTLTAAELPKALARRRHRHLDAVRSRTRRTRTVFPVFTRGGGLGMAGMQGGADALMIADPTTFRVLPWAPKTGWLLCDPYFASGEPVPFATRPLAPARARAARRGGLRATSPGSRSSSTSSGSSIRACGPEHAGQPGEPPDVSLLTHGYQYLTEQRYDLLDAGRGLAAARPRGARAAAALARGRVRPEPGRVHARRAAAGSARPTRWCCSGARVKQICRRNGYHATFMCRPRIPNVMSSGWHLHQSLRRVADGANAFAARGRERDRCRRPGGSSSPACSRTRAARPRSPRRRSTATSATGRTRSRPTGSSGGATTAARCCG